jgi:hypothetical protein
MVLSIRLKFCGVRGDCPGRVTPMGAPEFCAALPRGLPEPKLCQPGLAVDCGVAAAVA